MPAPTSFQCLNSGARVKGLQNQAVTATDTSSIKPEHHWKVATEVTAAASTAPSMSKAARMASVMAISCRKGTGRQWGSAKAG